MSPTTPKFHHILAIFLGLAVAAFAADSNDSAAPSTKETTPAQTTLAKLTAERDQLVASLNATTTELAALRARQASATAQPTGDSEKLRADLARVENELNEARAAARSLAAKNQQMEDVASERGRALAAAQAELAAKVAIVATPAPAVAAPAPDRSGEIEQLTAAKSAAEAHGQELATRLAALDQQIAELTARATAAETKLADAATPPPAVASSAGAEETEAKLATALRSYAMLQQELDQTREAAAKTETKLATAQAEAAMLRTQVDALNPNGQEMTLLRQASISAATEAVELRDQLRQAQGSVAQLAEENAQLRTRLALLGPPPAPMLASPARYAPTPPPAAVAKAAPTPSSATSAAKPAATAQQHVVVEGDTLSKISRRYYGTSERWPEILEANRDILRDARNLPMGASLRIP